MRRYHLSGHLHKQDVEGETFTKIKPIIVDALTAVSQHQKRYRVKDSHMQHIQQVLYLHNIERSMRQVLQES